MNPVIPYFEQFALVSFEKQDNLNRRLGEHILELDLDAGMARFGADTAFPFQLLGTESENTMTWLWAWADEQPEVPEALLRSAYDLKAWGAREGAAEFTLPSLDLNRADGTLLALIATAICGASGYYRDHYEGGNLYILLYGADSGHHPDLDGAGLVHAVRELASRYDFDHRKALLSYFSMKDLPVPESVDTLNTELAGGERFVVRFDHAGRILTINGDSPA